MADATKTLADVDTQWESIKAKYAAAQADYAKTRGRYFQLLPTMTAPPKDGTTKTPDLLTTKPHYQDKTTAQLAADYALTVPTRAGLEIHQYKQPNGTLGYVAYLTAQVTDAKGKTQTWTRAENMAGDEAYRTSGWTMNAPTSSTPVDAIKAQSLTARATERAKAIDWRYVAKGTAIGSALALGAAGAAVVGQMLGLW